MLCSSIKTKMTLAVFLLIALLMTAATITAERYFEREFKKSLADQQFALLDSVANQIDERLFDLLVDLDDLAESVTPAMLAHPERAQSLLDAQQRHRAFFDNSLFLFSETGRLIAASPRQANFIGKDFSFRQYFRDTMATGRMQISSPFASLQKPSRLIIMFTAPVYSGDRIVAVLGGSIDLRKQHYLRSLAALKLGANGFLSMYDTTRTVLMHSDRSRVLQRDPPELDNLIGEALLGFEGTRETRTKGGVQVLRSVKRLNSTDWVLAVSYPLKDAYLPLYSARNYFLALCLAGACLSLLIVWHLMVYLTRPLLSFTRHLERLPHLKGEERLVPVRCRDEIGVLAQAFNRMLGELEQGKLELKRQKEFAESLVLNSSLPTFVLNPRHEVLIWNRACEELTGVKGDQVVGTTLHWRAFYRERSRTLADVIIEGDFDSLPLTNMKCERSRLLQGGWHCEGWLEEICGQSRFVLLDATPIYNDRGELVAAIETIRDLTELKRAEQVLELSRDFYLTLFDNFPALIWRCGPDSRWDFFNRTWLEFTGRTLEQEKGDGWVAGMHPDDAPFCQAGYQEAFQSRAPFEMEYRLRRYDGQYRWIMALGRPFNDLNGSFAGYIGACYDVSDRKESEERYRQLFENNPHPMWAYDLETLRFLAVNEAAVRHYGYSRDEFLAMTIKDIRPAEDVPALLENVAQVTDQIDAAGVWRHLKQDGSVILVEITSHLMQFAGRPAELVLANDLTEKLRVERENRELEHQLTQSQKMEAIGTLTGGIAHDFNNILTAIVGYATLMQMEMEQHDPLQRKLSHILSASERAASLTRSLLAYSRKQASNPAPVGLNAIITRIEALLRRLIPENIEFRTALSNAELSIRADSGQMEQVLMNLIVNARDAMPGGGELSIATAAVTLERDQMLGQGYGGAGSYALLTIADTGIGMDKQTRERIFEPFFTTKEVGKGTGLGLAMVYGIVNQHDGFINCYSEPGQGTVFRIYLPLIDGAADPAAEPEQRELPRGYETVLLVEDDGVLREMVAELLRDFGYTVVTAVDGEDAVRKFRELKGSVHMVILDVIMPRLNGKDAYDAMSALAPGLKGLFMSGYTADIACRSSVVSESCSFVSKPIDVRELLTEVRRLLDAVP